MAAHEHSPVDLDLNESPALSPPPSQFFKEDGEELNDNCVITPQHLLPIANHNYLLDIPLPEICNRCCKKCKDTWATLKHSNPDLILPGPDDLSYEYYCAECNEKIDGQCKPCIVHQSKEWRCLISTTLYNLQYKYEQCEFKLAELVKSAQPLIELLGREIIDIRATIRSTIMRGHSSNIFKLAGEKGAPTVSFTREYLQCFSMWQGQFEHCASQKVLVLPHVQLDDEEERSGLDPTYKLRDRKRKHGRDHDKMYEPKAKKTKEISTSSLLEKNLDETIDIYFFLKGSSSKNAIRFVKRVSSNANLKSLRNTITERDAFSMENIIFILSSNFFGAPVC